MNNDNELHSPKMPPPSLPGQARLPINRCNLPPQILGSLSFQAQPTTLAIDGVAELHKQLFELLDAQPQQTARLQQFMDYMVVQFRLEQLEDAGLVNKQGRSRADYLRLLRGWFFNTEGREAAVLKAWVESRFGLLTRYHNGRCDDHDSDSYQAYIAARSEGLYGTNALESQLDLLYSYCQYELALQYPPQQRLQLFRGVNNFDAFDILAQRHKRHAVVLLNNLNSFTTSQERACEFGDIIMAVDIPWQKVLYYSKLFPGMYIGEDEYIVIGGVYEVETRYW